MDLPNSLIKQGTSGSIDIDNHRGKGRMQNNEDDAVNIKEEADTTFVSVGIEHDYDQISMQEEDYAKIIKQEHDVDVKEEPGNSFATGCEMNFLFQEATESVSSNALLTL